MTSDFVGHDFFGAGNFGDDIALAGFLTVAAEHPNVQITICTPYDVESQRALFPRVRWLPGGGAERESALRGADVWLGLGGTPFQLDSGPWLLDHNDDERRRCAALGKPMYLLGIGCENPEAAADPRAHIAGFGRAGVDARRALRRGAAPVHRDEPPQRGRRYGASRVRGRAAQPA